MANLNPSSAATDGPGSLPLPASNDPYSISAAVTPNTRTEAEAALTMNSLHQISSAGPVDPSTVPAQPNTVETSLPARDGTEGNSPLSPRRPGAVGVAQQRPVVQAMSSNNYFEAAARAAEARRASVSRTADAGTGAVNPNHVAAVAETENTDLQGRTQAGGMGGPVMGAELASSGAVAAGGVTMGAPSAASGGAASVPDTAALGHGRPGIQALGRQQSWNQEDWKRGLSYERFVKGMPAVGESQGYSATGGGGSTGSS